MSIDYEDYVSSSDSISTYPNFIEYARITYGKRNSYFMKTERITIGRNSTDGMVDIDIGPHTFVSRKHLEVSYSFQKLKVKCLGKNGIFIDNYFKAHSHVAYELPEECILRFPSTDVEVMVQQLVGRLKDGERYKTREIGIDVNRGDSYVCRDKKRDEIEMNTYMSKPCDLEEKSLVSCVQQQPTTTHQDMEIYSNCIPRRNIGGADMKPCELRVQNVEMGKRSVLPQIIINPRSYQTYSYNSNDILYGQTGQIFSSTIDTKDLAIEYGTETQKPPYSYAQLIVQAVSTCSARQLTLNGIYNYISKHYPYFKSHDKGWQNSVRHNLSLNRYFLKVPRAQDEPGKGSFWRIDAAYEGKLITQAFRKRRLRNNVCVTNDSGSGQTPHVVAMAGARANNAVFTFADHNTKLNTFYSVKRTDHKTTFVVKKMNDLNSVTQKFISVVNGSSRGQFKVDKKISVLTPRNVFPGPHTVKKRLYPSTIHLVGDSITPGSSSSSSSLHSGQGTIINIDGQLFSAGSELKPIKVMSSTGGPVSLVTVAKPQNKYILIPSSNTQYGSSISGPTVCITGSGSLFRPHNTETLQNQSLPVHRSQSPSSTADHSHGSSTEMAPPLSPVMKYTESMELDFETDQFLISSPNMEHSGYLDLYQDDHDRDGHTNNNEDVLWQDSSLCFHDVEIEGH